VGGREKGGWGERDGARARGRGREGERRVRGREGGRICSLRAVSLAINTLNCHIAMMESGRVCEREQERERGREQEREREG